MNYKAPEISSQNGFTLIELVMVIVILGILAAVAIPQFTDLSGDAKTASVRGIGAAISAGAQLNYTNKIMGKTSTTVSNCQTATSVLQGIANHAAFKTQNTDVAVSDNSIGAAEGDAMTCNIWYSGTGGTTLTFSSIRVN
jgi:MSHA pilin protein MshA